MRKIDWPAIFVVALAVALRVTGVMDGMWLLAGWMIGGATKDINLWPRKRDG